MTTVGLTTTLPRGPRLRVGSIAPSPACGGGSGRGLAEPASRSVPRESGMLRETAAFPLPNPPPQAGEGARGVVR
jgi:hypothetical protein